METGSKVWLVGYLVLIIALLHIFPVYPILAHFLVYVGVLSSFAEVSHYLCHTSNSRVILLFSQCGLLLSKRHHAHHHLEDNVNYAFLNGWTDQLLNQIARQLYPGYKNTTDVHFAYYDTVDTEKRSI
jgi:sterol desaturase/sphingolipid hydroxylase (fatty acid hydroxylase superfamily)